MTREQMYDLIISKLGHEDKATIWFISLAEEYPNADNKKLEKLLDSLFDLININNKGDN